MQVINNTKAYTATEAAQLLGVSYVTVRKYIKEGRIQAVKAGNRYLVTERNLILFLNGIGVKPMPQPKPAAGSNTDSE